MRDTARTIYTVLVMWLGVTAVRAAQPSRAPLIGVLTQQWDAEHSYMAASYAKLVEMGGGRAVAIHHNAPLSQIRRMHNSLNGVILPGGNTGGNYSAAVSLLVNLTLQVAQKSGGRDQVPLWGICLGFEMLSWNIARNRSVSTSPWGALLLPRPLVMSNTSRMFAGVDMSLLHVMGHENVTMHNHGGGVAPEVFLSNDRLRATFDVTSTAVGRTGRRFANVIEGKNGLHIYGTIWHPEMPPFEHEMAVIPHSKAAVRTSQWVADFFVEQCRRANKRHFGPPGANSTEIGVAEARVVIAGDAPHLVDCRGDGSQITQCYYWRSPAHHVE